MPKAAQPGESKTISPASASSKALLTISSIFLRPSIIFSEENSGIVSVIPLTSKKKALDYSYTLEISKSEKNGLREDSVALVFHLKSIDVRRLRENVGFLEDEHLNKLNSLLKELLKI